MSDEPSLAGIDFGSLLALLAEKGGCANVSLTTSIQSKRLRRDKKS